MWLVAATIATGAGVAVRVDASPARRIASIRPLRALGAGVDSDPRGKIPLLYSAAHTALALEAGLGTLSYRLYTELSVQDWHWNPRGRWSDAARAQGYWTSDASPHRSAIVDSFGYLLPHRGATRDQGDDVGYSVIDDANPLTYWKSNPYLSSRYTGESDALHPQWVVVDLGKPRSVDAIRIAWTNPYATRYRVDYWTGPDAIAQQGRGSWHAFPRGAVDNHRAGTVFTRLSARPLSARFVRVAMTASSNTCDTHGSADPRNCVGYAIEDVGVGTLEGRGRFADVVRRSTCGGDPADVRRCGGHQTPMYPSSIDPWHRASDRVRGDQDQPGLDTVTRSGFSRGRPMIYPVALWYSTPQNAVNEVRYLRGRGYPIGYVELGEEVDGQYATPEDYGALYLQWARAIHGFDPTLRLGGPVFMGWNEDPATWRNAAGDASWLHRFLLYLRHHGALRTLSFMSFEHYPFHGCDAGALLHDDLLREPALMRAMTRLWRADGLPSSVPTFITEANFSADGAPVALQVEGALWMADWIGTALSSGVSEINYYQYEAEPASRSRRCGRYGAYSLFITGGDFRIRARSAQFYAAQMLTRHWLQFGDRPNGLYAVTTNQPARHPELSAYAARRPDGEWSVMLVNKGRAARPATIAFSRPGQETRPFRGPVSVTVFGRAQYDWDARSLRRLPAPNRPPQTTAARGGRRSYLLPAESIVVVRGRV